MSSLKGLPWWVKVICKLGLSRMPFAYSMWNRLNLFRHGNMDKPEYAYGVFKKHFNRIFSENYPRNSVVLELGPGDSLFSAVIAYAFGAGKSYLVDVGNYARLDVKPYEGLVDYLLQKQLQVQSLKDFCSVEHLLEICNAEYLTGGLSSLYNIPDKSVDFIFSHAVLEHVKAEEFLQVLREIRRIIRDNGISSHRIDLTDHMGGALNNLRFPQKVWESEFFSKSSFYTNRIRYYEMLTMFQQAGFEVEIIQTDRWDCLPTPKDKMASRFRCLSEEELSVYGFDVILKPFHFAAQGGSSVKLI